MFWVCVLYTPLSSMATPSLFPLSCSFRRSILGSGELFYLICVVLHSSSAPFLFSSLPFPLSPFPTNPWGLKGAGARDWVCSTIYGTFAQFPGVPAPGSCHLDITKNRVCQTPGQRWMWLLLGDGWDLSGSMS